MLSVSILIHAHFYPRSPCGERRQPYSRCFQFVYISIHALLAESDRFRTIHNTQIDISIHALLAESDSVTSIFIAISSISIHALLAESDTDGSICFDSRELFLSTLSLRRATHSRRSQKQRHPNFYPRSPCGERHQWVGQVCRAFQISIHALLAESDSSFA